MKLAKYKFSPVENAFLALDGISVETFEHPLANRSPLGWVIDEYQLSTDKHRGITNDPDRLDDPEYIVRLLGQAITVSLETRKLVGGLPIPLLQTSPSN